MRALILAAGVGRRLGLDDMPKSLLRFGSESLLSRHLRCLRALGIEQVVICVGFEAAQIEAEIARVGASGFVRTVYNSAFTEGSMVSLWTVRRALVSDTPLLLMDADVLYDAALLARLADTRIPNCFLLDREFESGDEPVKLCVRGERLVEFRKRLSPELRYDYCGESVGFFRFSADMARRLANRVEDYVNDGRREEPYEEAIRDLMLQNPKEFWFEDVTGLPWIEIDFPEDIARARTEIEPKLSDTDEQLRTGR